MFLRDNRDIVDNIALVDAFGNQMTYRDMDQLSEEYLKLIPERSLVFILCDYDMDTVSFYYSMMNNHVVPLLLDKNLKYEMLDNLIQLYEPQYIWISKKRVEQFKVSFPVAWELDKHVVLRTPYKIYEIYEQLALLLTTSGSTGSPKLVSISYNNLISNTRSIIELLKLKEDDRAITTLPMNYCYGLSLFHMHWMAGASVYLTDWSMLNIRFWRFLTVSKITNFQGVPYTFEILEKIGFLDKEYPSLRFVTQAGAKLLEDKQSLFGRKFTEKGIQFFILYGQTEGTTYLAGMHSEKVLDKIGSIGRAIEGMEVYLQDCKLDSGELSFMGDSVSLGYVGCKEELKDRTYQKILRTGDLARIDEEGYIYIIGRKKRIVKILGVRINLDEIELMLRKEFPELDIACIGTDKKIRIIYSGVANERAVIAFCKDAFSVHRGNLSLEKIESIPRNRSGKIIYSELI